MTLKTKKEIEKEIEKKAWECGDCELLIYHTIKPNNCSCGHRSSYFENSQVTSLVKRQIQSKEKDVLEIIDEFNINKFMELHKVQQLLAIDYSEEELLELFKQELKQKFKGDEK